MIQIKTPDLGGINNSIEAVLYCKPTCEGLSWAHATKQSVQPRSQFTLP